MNNVVFRTSRLGLPYVRSPLAGAKHHRVASPFWEIASSMGEPHQQLHLAVAHVVAVEVDIDSQKRSLS